MAKVGSAILKQGSCPRQWGGDLPSEGWAAGSALPIRCSLSRIGGGESSRPRLGIIPALAVEVTHSMAALRDSLNACAACTLPAVPLHWRYTWDAYHVGLAGQGGAGAQGAAGFSPRGPSDGATAGIHRAGGIGGLLAVEAPQAVGDPLRHWYFYDSNGNVGQLLAYDATGPTVNAAPAAKYEYDPYGQLIKTAGTYADANPFRFSTKWFDTETGLGYWAYRYYSPRLGRLLSRDPIQEAGGLLMYAYVLNSPIDYIDLFGLDPQTERKRIQGSVAFGTSWEAEYLIDYGDKDQCVKFDTIAVRLIGITGISHFPPNWVELVGAWEYGSKREGCCREITKTYWVREYPNIGYRGLKYTILKRMHPIVVITKTQPLTSQPASQPCSCPQP